MKLFRFHKSFNSVVIGLAKSGNFVPPEIADTMTQQAIDYRSVNRHLIPLCECSQLRDTGLVATNVSPMVVDLTQPLPESPKDSEITALYPRMLDKKVIYKNTEHQLLGSDHQLRRNTFYVPFFQKINAELDRLTKTFGRATLLLTSCDSRLQGRTVRIAGDLSSHDFSTAIQAAEEMGIEFEVSPRGEHAFIGRRDQSDRENVCSLKLSPESLLEGNHWSDEKADRMREFLATLIGTFSA